MVEPSKELQLVFEKAIADARKLQHEYVTVEHILFAMLCEENFENIVTGYGADPAFIKSNLENHLKTYEQIQERRTLFLHMQSRLHPRSAMEHSQ